MFTVTITISSETGLTDHENNILRALAPANNATTAPVLALVPEKGKRGAKAPVAEPVVEPEPEEDILGGAEVTLEDAVKRATELVSAGGTPRVKAALTAIGVKRVSELKGASIAAFLEALDD